MFEVRQIASGTAFAVSFPLLSIAECHGLDGTPLFDPRDERPVEASCPQGLRFIGGLDQSFFGTDGGICCGRAEPVDADDRVVASGDSA